jgi:hypothetical protein
MFFFFSFLSVAKITINKPGYHAFITGEQDEIEVDLRNGKLSTIVIFPEYPAKEVSFSIYSTTGQNTILNVKDFHAMRINGSSANFLVSEKTFLQIWLFNSTNCKDGAILFKTEHVIMDNLSVDSSKEICIFYANNAQLKNQMRCTNGGAITTYGVFHETEVRPDGVCFQKSQCSTNAQIPQFLEISNCSNFEISIKAQTSRDSFIKGCDASSIPVFAGGVLRNQTAISSTSTECIYQKKTPAFLVVAYVLFAVFALAMVVGIVLTCIKSNKYSLTQQEAGLLNNGRKEYEDEIEL